MTDAIKPETDELVIDVDALKHEVWKRYGVNIGDDDPILVTLYLGEVMQQQFESKMKSQLEVLQIGLEQANSKQLEQAKALGQRTGNATLNALKTTTSSIEQRFGKMMDERLAQFQSNHQNNMKDLRWVLWACIGSTIFSGGCVAWLMLGVF